MHSALTKCNYILTKRTCVRQLICYWLDKILLLMKSDKVVNASEKATDTSLFFVVWIGQIYLFQIRVM